MDTVSIAVSGLALVVCAACAAVCWRLSRRLAADVRFRTSTLAELHEIRDYMSKLDAWSKRINARLAMAGNQNRAGPASQPSTEPSASDPAALKAHLRRIAGIIPGKPAPHRE